MFITMIKKYAVLICLITAFILLVIASQQYPGGSILDKNSVGFDWTKNYLSNLFTPKAVNGADNPGWIWATVGMAFNSIGFSLFFINMAKKLAYHKWSVVLKVIGIANFLLIFLIATPLHDLGVFSIVLTLLGLFTITIFMLKTKLHLLKVASILCVLLYYAFFIFFGFGFTELAVIMQKVYFISTILLVVGLEYFTRREDFVYIVKTK